MGSYHILGLLQSKPNNFGSNRVSLAQTNQNFEWVVASNPRKQLKYGWYEVVEVDEVHLRHLYRAYR